MFGGGIILLKRVIEFFRVLGELRYLIPVMRYKFPDPDDPASVMQIDLCGGFFGLPEFASAPPVLTFATLIQKEMDANVASLRKEMVILCELTHGGRANS